MTFLAIKLLYFLFTLPFLVVLKLWADWRAQKVLDHFSAPRLRHDLVQGTSGERSWLIFALQLLALGCFIIALARPRWGEDKIVQQEYGRNVIIAIDTSRSMLGNDIAPDRITRAKLAAQDVLASLKTDRVGLIAFAGNAYLQAPLTTDHDAVIEAIQSLDFTAVPRGGSEIGRALKLAMETFEKSPAKNHGLILFSDGGEPDLQIAEYTKQAAQKNVLVLTVGVGTEAGSLIPDPDPDRAGEYVRDQSGNVVKTKLEPKVLQDIAGATRGRYLKLGSQPLAESVVKQLLSALQAQSNAAKELVKPIERFYWPLSLGILILIIAWLIRPSSERTTMNSNSTIRWGQSALPLFLALVFITAESSAAPAGLASVTGANASTMEKAHAAYKHGDFKKATDLYDEAVKDTGNPDRRQKLAFGLGTAAYQNKDYDRAISGFGQALEAEDVQEQSNAHRGLAHSLYDLGDRSLAKQPKFSLKAWRECVKHFDDSLKIDPENKDVKENRDFVKKRLDELQKQMDEKEGKDGKKGDKGKKGQKGKKGEKGQKGDGEEGEDGEQDGEGDGEGDDEEKARKESLGKQEDKDAEEGEGGDKEKEKEGQLQAGKEGEQEGKEARERREAKEAEQAENQQNEATGFSRNEARAFLRTYADDQKKAMLLRPRDAPVNGKDW
jgi:Ca-activated chloride channel homolog